MQDIPQEQAIKRLQVLPDALKDVIFSDKTSDSILKNCTLRDVSGNTIPLIGQLTTRVLLGYLRPELFASEIQKETDIEELKAQHIAHDIDTEIFSEVRLELKKLYPPTVLTPNVQNQGFSRDYTAPTPAPVVKPKYVIPIPEKFQNKSFPGITTTPAKQDVQKNSLESIADSKKAESNLITTPQTPEPIIENKNLKPTPAPISQQETRNSENTNILIEKKLENTEKETPQTDTTTTQKEPSLAPKIGEKPTQPSIKIAQTIEPSGVKINPVVPLPTFIGARFQQSNIDTPKISDEKIKEMASKFVTSSTAQPKPPQESAYKEKIDTSNKQGTIDLSKF